MALEEHQLAAPKLEAILQTGQLELTFSFDSEPACAIVTAEIQHVKYAASFAISHAPSMASLPGSVFARWMAWRRINALMTYGGLVATALLIVVLGLYPFRLSFTGDRLSQLLIGYSRPDLGLLLFVPFGIASFLSVRGPFGPGGASIVALVLSASLSFAIEVLQAFDPGQVSSTTDALLAITAAGVGVAAAYLFEARLVQLRELLQGF
jgi:VanZ family protein